MRNIDVSTFTILDDREKRIVRVSVSDIESNVVFSQDVTIAKSVERRSKKQGDTVLGERMNSRGDRLYIIIATDDDILNKQNALISKAVRTLGLRLIPGDIIDECMDICIETMRSRDAEDPDAAKRKIFDSFAGLGITVENLKTYLGNDGSNMSPKEINTLRALFTAIRDGETTWREAMDSRKPKVDDSKKANQTPRQKYETVKLQLSAAGKKDKADEFIKMHEGMSGRKEKDFDQSDLDYLIKEMGAMLK